MLDLLGTPECHPFTVALGVMLIIGAVEGASTLLGLSVSDSLDSILPDFELDADVEAPGDVLSQTLSWLRIGRVPVLILFIFFLTAFGLAGLAVQVLLHSLTGWLAPSWVAVVPAFLVALPAMRVSADVFARILPREETSAVSRKTFVGRVGHIVIGTARCGSPAQARVKDETGRTHYVMVEPDVDGEEFKQGDPVLLVRAAEAHFRVIRPENDALLEPALQTQDKEV